MLTVFINFDSGAKLALEKSMHSRLSVTVSHISCIQIRKTTNKQNTR